MVVFRVWRQGRRPEWGDTLRSNVRRHSLARLRFSSRLRQVGNKLPPRAKRPCILLRKMSSTVGRFEIIESEYNGWKTGAYRRDIIYI